MLNVTQRHIVVLEWLSAVILVRPVQLQKEDAGKVLTVLGRG